MPKILSQSGDSLADVYDVKGSIAGIDQLETRELPIVHEMGNTVFSERLGAEIVRLPTGDILQNANFDVTLASPPPNIFRVLGVVVLLDTTTRINIAQVSLRSTVGREVPFFVWDIADDIETSIRIVENNAAATNTIALRSRFGPQGGVPTLGVSDGQPRMVGEEIVFRGRAAGFGAGTVECIALVHLASPEVTQGSLSSRGLPVPGW